MPGIESGLDVDDPCVVLDIKAIALFRDDITAKSPSWPYVRCQSIELGSDSILSVDYPRSYLFGVHGSPLVRSSYPLPYKPAACPSHDAGLA